MTTTHTATHTPTNTTNRRRPPHTLSIGATVIAAAALFVSIRQTADAPSQPITPATPAERTLSEREVLEDLVNRGLVPRQALEPTRKSEREVLEDLVNRGLVPRQALEPTPATDREILEDLVNRGLVPRQSLEPGLDPDDES